MTVLSDDFPVLLAPVRVETRFTDTELLVRVFPDEWAVDAFEPRPTAAEISAIDAYWTALWRAGGNAVAEAAAWLELTGRVPAGRAFWLLDQHRPANPQEQPTGVPAGTTVLVVVTTEPVAAQDKPPTVAYWTAVWRAHGERQALRAADSALQSAVGGQRADAIRARRPTGIDAAATNPSDEVEVAFLVLEPPDPAGLAPRSWTQAARARLLPDRFTVLGYANGQQVLAATGASVPESLAVSADPGAADQFTIDEQTGALQVPDDLLWLTDFDRAVQVGMGLRIPLDDQLRDGLDRLVVLGLREGTGPQQAGVELGDLLTRQLRSPTGFSLLPQGTPTNNSDQAAAGQDETERATAAQRVTAELAAATGDWTTKTDGAWLAESLGLDPAVLAGVANADGTDQRDARAANTALWPATWGYYLQTMLHPILGPQAVERTRDFFTRYVSGRGSLPVIQLGRQPYGIIPTTAFSKLEWPDAGPVPAAHRRALQDVLRTAAQDWRIASAKVARLGDIDDTADPHQLLLDILALHPTSAEFYQRYALSVEDVYNRENLGSLGPAVLPALDTLNMPQPIRALLARLGHAGPPAQPDPALVRRLFVGTQYPLLAPLVDDRPLSETAAIRPYTNDRRNYLRWLADNAGTDLEAVRLERDFAADKPPAALLYLLLRHAVLLGWEDAARRLAIAAGSTDVPEPVDPLFVHIGLGDPDAPSESRFRQLYSPDPAVTGDPDTLLVDFVPTALDGRPATTPLAEQVGALGLLAAVPTAKLERVLVEHLDCATYRLDAWQLGLATERLAELRYGPDGTEPARLGIHLGAYGWLEDFRPRATPLSPIGDLPDPLAEIFTPPGSTPLLHDPDNGGFIHAPSPAQATTAAVLRAGYLANAEPDNPGAFAVNLSSERVRVALTVLDGMREGQSLGALLGYRFERGLHDRFPEAELDTIITALRGAFPLRAGRIAETTPEPGTSAELIEARNVIDGLELVRRVTRTADKTYPFGAEGLPEPTDDQFDAIEAEVRRLLDIHDSVADLAVAESTHQALAGNAERAAATLDAFAKEGFAPDPAVVRTPRSGITLTHRLGLELTPGLTPANGATPRAQAEPAVDAWLPTLLPDRDDVAARVTWADPVTGDDHAVVVTQHDVGLNPIDLLWTVRSAGEAAMTDLDDRIIGVVVERDRPRPDAVLTIRYTERVPDSTTFFELAALMAALRTVLTTSRPLRSSDLKPAAGPSDVDRSADDAVSLPRQRPATVRASLDSLRQNVSAYLADLAPLFPEPPAPVQRAAVIGNIDTFLRRYAQLAVTAAGCGILRSGWGELAAWRRGVFAGILAEVERTADRMDGSLAAADALLAQYDALPQSAPDQLRFQLLQQAERLIATTPTSPLPARPSQLRNIVRDRRQAFADRVQDLRDISGTGAGTLSALLAEVAALLPLSAFDPTGLDLTPFEDRIVAFAGDLLARAQTLHTEILRRLAAGDAALAEYDAAITAPDRVAAGVDALKALLGEDVLAIPEFTPPGPLVTELRGARAASPALVQHLIDAGRDFPIDDWLHGVARVREVPRVWERILLLADALRGEGGLLGEPDRLPDPLLTPVQLPLRPNDHWLGMEFAAGTEIVEDRLLYTAHYASDPPPSQPNRCGLLLDEWTEVIPATRETTAIAANLDRPDSEPAQAMLLVVPPVRTGTWSVDDLVAAITETYELAQLRAVEPEHLDDTAYAHLLPATTMSATRRQITISTDLAIANLRWKARD